MASFNPLKGTLVINVQTGVNSQGEPLVKARRYQSVKASASADALLTTGNAIAGLQKHTLLGVSIDQVSNVVA